MSNLKTSKRNKLQTKHDLPIALYEIEPRWRCYVKKFGVKYYSKYFFYIIT